jgi:hypothetical protein
VPEHENDHSIQSSSEVKNAWSNFSTPPISLRGVVIKYRIRLHGVVLS